MIPGKLRQPCVSLVSRHIPELFYREVLEHDHKMFWEYFKIFSSAPESGPPASWLWELYAAQELSDQKPEKRTVSIQPITPSLRAPAKKRIRISPGHIELPFFQSINHGDVKDTGKRLSAIVSPGTSPIQPTVLRPGARNQVTFNAFSISGGNVVTLYQATIQKSDSIKTKGLDFVWDALRLTGGQKLSLWKWRLVFLIPADVKDD